MRTVHGQVIARALLLALRSAALNDDLLPRTTEEMLGVSTLLGRIAESAGCESISICNVR
jgi:hypothetical protein